MRAWGGVWAAGQGAGQLLMDQTLSDLCHVKHSGSILGTRGSSEGFGGNLGEIVLTAVETARSAWI